MGEFYHSTSNDAYGYLDSDQSPDDCIGLSDLDGFLTAIVVGPELVISGEWLPMIWGDEEPELESEAKWKR